MGWRWWRHDDDEDPDWPAEPAADPDLGREFDQTRRKVQKALDDLQEQVERSHWYREAERDRHEQRPGTSTA